MNFFYFTKRNISTEMTNEHILLELQRIFYIHLLTNDLYLYNNEKKMMDMLRSESGENWDTNTIYLFKIALTNEELVIKALLHEYTHATQDEKKVIAARAKGYENNPYEKAAERAERNWKNYL